MVPHFCNMYSAPPEYLCVKPFHTSRLTAPLRHSAKMTICLLHLHLKKEEAVLRAAWRGLSGQTLAMQSILLSECDWRGSRGPRVPLQVLRHFLIAALASAPSLQCPRGNGSINYYSFMPIRESCWRPINYVKELMRSSKPIPVVGTLSDV